MSFFSDLAVRVQSLVRRRVEEHDVDDEVHFHIERDVEERVRRGESPDQARRAAVLGFGNVEQWKEEVRDARGTRALEDFGADVRYALRGLRRNPAFALTGILVLGMGIGATATVYSVVHAVVLAGLPYPQPDQLVRVVEKNSPTNIWALSTADVISIGERQRVFSDWGASSRREVALSGAGAPQRIMTTGATAGFFRTVGISVARGRSVLPSDELPDAPEVAVVTDAFARRLAGGADFALGKTLALDGVTHTVVGVFPPGRDELGGIRSEVWTALKLPPIVRRGPFWLRGVGRLKPGVTLEAATADLARISAEILPLWSDFRDSTAKLTPQPLHDVIVGRSARQVWLFAAAVALVLLLAIVNVATLVLLRASGREHELAVRVMLGARRGRVARLLVTENVLLTSIAAIFGLLLAIGGVRLAVAQLATVPRIQDVSLDWRVVLLGASIAIVSGIFVSLSPIGALRRHNTLASHAAGQRTSSGYRTNRMRSAFVIAQFALASPLLVASGLLLNSFVRLHQVSLGFDPTGLIAVGVNLPRARYPDASLIERFQSLALQRISALAEVTSVALASDVPPDPNYGGYDNFTLVHRPVPAGQAEPNVPWYAVGTEYFSTLGVRVTDGRNFTVADTDSGAPPVVIVSESFVRQYLPGESAVGRQLVQGGCYDCPRTTIVGVVSDVRNLGPAQPMVAAYGPLGASGSFQVLVRTTALAPVTMAAIRDALRGLDPELPIVETIITDHVDASVADPKRWASVLSAFATSGLGLAALGVFGLMALSVRQRRREIGVRLALGAGPSEVTRLVVARGMKCAAIGSAIGLAVTLVFVNRLQSLLFGVSSTDLLTLTLAGTVLLGAALLASWIPGRRAARVKPMEAIAID